MGFLDFVHLMHMHICVSVAGVFWKLGTNCHLEHCMLYYEQIFFTDTHTHNFQHNHHIYARKMPQWETTTPKFLVNKTVPSAWSHSHRKSLFVRPPHKKLNSRVPHLGSVANVPKFPTHKAQTTLWSSGIVRCCMIMDHDKTKTESFLGAFFKQLLSTCPVCCSNIDSWASQKVFTVRVTNWFHAPDGNVLVSCWDTCLNSGGYCCCHVEK